VTTGLLTLEASAGTFEVLCAAMAQENTENGSSGNGSFSGSNRMANHVDRAMIELGVAPKVNGPLFLRIRSAMAPYLARTPQSLMSLARHKIRRALLLNKGPKRLTTKASQRPLQSLTTQKASQLHLPQKLRQFITMGE